MTEITDQALNERAYIQQGERQRAARMAGEPFRVWLYELAKIAAPRSYARWIVDNVVLNEECWFECFADGMTPAQCWAEECSY